MHWACWLILESSNLFNCKMGEQLFPPPTAAGVIRGGVLSPVPCRLKGLPVDSHGDGAKSAWLRTYGLRLCKTSHQGAAFMWGPQGDSSLSLGLGCTPESTALSAHLPANSSSSPWQHSPSQRRWPEKGAAVSSNTTLCHVSGQDTSLLFLFLLFWLLDAPFLRLSHLEL